MEEIVIIGGGPAGITSAIQLKRYGYNPIVFEKNNLGGLLLNANRIDNYPGFPNGISGKNIVRLFKNHFLKYDLKLVKEEVVNLDYKNDFFIIRTNNRVIKASTTIVATGTIPKTIENSNIPQFAKKKVFYEIVNILNEENKEIAIIGAGDAAFDYALNLSKKNNVYILNRSDKIKALSVLVEECKNNPKINYSPSLYIEKINLKDKRLLLNCNDNKIFEVDYLVFAIGRKPNLKILSERIKSIKEELILSKKLFFIGDVKNGDFRQVSISIADGIKAAMEIYFK